MNDEIAKKGQQRIKDAALTKKRILAASQTRFSTYGYDNVGTRDIASDAGVDAALINRYFGSKEKLFAEAIKGGFDLTEHLPQDLGKLGIYLVDQVLNDARIDEGSDTFDALGILLHPTANNAIANMIAEQFHNEFTSPLSQLLSGKDPEVRAALIASYVIGLATMRHKLASSVLSSESAKHLAALAIQNCVTVG